MPLPPRLCLLASRRHRTARALLQREAFDAFFRIPQTSTLASEATNNVTIASASSLLSRSLSTSTSTSSFLSPLASSMLAHVRSPLCTDKPEEAIDILRTGLAGSPPSTLDEAALLLAWSDVEASRCGHGAAAELAARAADAAASAAVAQTGDLPGLYLRLAADDARLRSSLTLSSSSVNDDDGMSGAEAAAADATEAASRASDSPVASASAAGMASMLSHARGDAEAARSLAEAVESALRRAKEEGEVERHGALELASLAASRAAAVRLASGEAASAVELYSEAVSLAERAAAAAAVSSSNSPSPLAAADATLVALSGRAQARSASALPRPPPTDAEEDATRALSSFDDESEKLAIARPEAAAAPLLLVLGQIFATSGGRVMVAEGLFRRAAQRLKIPAASSPPPRHLPGGCVHPSVASALAWRYAQLLTALPKRGTEAEGWANAATSVSSSSPPFSSREELERELGMLDALTGKGERGRGVVVDAGSRRVLPSLGTGKL